MSAQPNSISKNAFQTGLCLLTWFAIILQLSILKESVFNYISYFTILSNLLIAISLTAIILAPHTKIGKYFSLTTVQSSIALNILIVGLVYNTVLRGIWEPKGWQLLADNLLHVVVPVLYILYWIVFIPKGTLTWRDGTTWAYFPLAYLAYSLIRGHFVNWYPYPFLDVAKFGYGQVAINSGFVVLAFLFFGALMIWADRLTKKSSL